MPGREHHLAVMTNWAFLGSFGLCFAISGFNGGNLLAGLLGFALIVLGFASHILINYIFRAEFSKGEAALGFTLFAISVLGFAVSWIVVPDFGWPRVAIGLSGFTTIVVSFAFYMFANHGVRGSFEMFDEIRKL